MRFTNNTWKTMDLLQNKSIDELIVIQDKFIDAHIHLMRHSKKHFEFLAIVNDLIQKQRDAIEEHMDFQYMGSWDNPFFEINNKHAREACLALKRKKPKKERK